VLSQLGARDDRDRERLLLLRGTKYMLAAVVGPTVVLMVLADHVLAVWLGNRFIDAAPAGVIFVSLWLVAPNIFIANTMLVVERRLKQLMIYSWGTAALNLALSIVLTASFGLIGVAIGTTVGYLALMPYFVSFAFKGHNVRIAEFARIAWLPAYGLGLLLAAALFVVRATVALDHVWSVAIAATAGVLGYWGAFYMFAMDDEEKRMVRGVVRRRPSP
jgi:O-antigen/teichoic acid export membrane protein